MFVYNVGYYTNYYYTIIPTLTEKSRYSNRTRTFTLSKTHMKSNSTTETIPVSAGVGYREHIHNQTYVIIEHFKTRNTLSFILDGLQLQKSFDLIHNMPIQ